MLWKSVISSCSRRASSSVLPTTKPRMPNSLTSDALRPWRTAAARTSFTTGSASCGLSALMNSPSALWPAKSRPRGDTPAWMRNGVRCGDGSVRCRPTTS